MSLNNSRRLRLQNAIAAWKQKIADERAAAEAEAARIAEQERLAAEAAAAIDAETYTNQAIAALASTAPEALDTLEELAAALGDDPNFASSVTTSLGTKVDKINVTGGSVGSSTGIPVITYNSQGQITSASETGITVGNGSMTVNTGSGLVGGAQLGTANQQTNTSVTISHADTSSVSNVNNSGNTFIQDLTFDSFGHVTGATSGSVTVGDGAMTVTAGSGLSGGGQLGTANQSGASSITLNHADTSSVSNIDTSGKTVIDALTFDTYGHVTGATSRNLDFYTTSEADGRYVNVTGDTMTGALTASGGINGLTLANGITGTNYNITGVNQLEIADPGEGIVWKSGSSGDMLLAIVDDTSDSRLNLSGTGASMSINNQRVFADDYHPNADKWTTARTLSLTGDVSGSVSWDGSGNASMTTTVANDSHSHSNYLLNTTDSEQTGDFGTIYWNQGSARVNSDPRTNEPGYDSDLTNIHWWSTTAAGANYGRVGHALYNGSAYQYLHTKANQSNLYINNNVVWNAGNDGSGSGLDADLLDGQHASSFAAANHSHSYLPLSGGTITGNVTLTGADSENALTLTGTMPTIALIDNVDDNFFIHVNSNNFYILNDRDGNGSYNSWEAPYALQLEADTNIGYLFGDRIFDEGYHPNADKWTTARSLTLTGDVTGSVSWDGSANASITATVVNDSHNHNHSDGNFTVNGDLYGKAVNGAYSSIYRMGGIYFTWDSDSYGTNINHSIRSTYGDTYGDDITINSYGNVRINIDSNNNGADRFEIGQGTTGTGNVIFTTDEAGNTTSTGSLRSPIFYDSANTAYYWNPNDSSAHKFQTPSGYIHIGPMNTSHCHLQTDRSNFYFNKELRVDTGVIGSYNENLILRRAANSADQITVASGYSVATGSMRAPLFYDSNNTAYYANPASTSYFNDFRCDIMYDKDNTAYYVRPGSTSILNDARANIWYSRSNTGYYSDPESTSRLNAVDFNSGTLRGPLVVPTGNRDDGVFGTYDSYKTQHIWSMGTSYRNAADGSTFGNLYGLAYKHTNNATGGSMGGSHQMVWCQNGSAKCSLGSSIWTSGNVTAYSDIRVKTNLEIIPDALEKVKQLNGYTFDRTDVKYDEDGEPLVPIRQTGVVAQEVLKVLPEAVTGDEENHYSVAYGNMVGLLIEAVKELDAKVKDLEAKLNGN